MRLLAVLCTRDGSSKMNPYTRLLFTRTTVSMKVWMSIPGRISKLEERYADQAQRLQHFPPRRSMSRPGVAGPCTLVDRVEVLEQGMDLLLRAQVRSFL